MCGPVTLCAVPVLAPGTCPCLQHKNAPCTSPALIPALSSHSCSPSDHPSAEAPVSWVVSKDLVGGNGDMPPKGQQLCRMPQPPYLKLFLSWTTGPYWSRRHPPLSLPKKPPSVKGFTLTKNGVHIRVTLKAQVVYKKMSAHLCEWTGDCSSCWVVRLDTLRESF